MFKFVFIVILGFTLQACSNQPISFKQQSFTKLEQTQNLNSEVFREKFFQNCRILSRRSKITAHDIFGTPDKWKQVCEKVKQEENTLQAIKENFSVYEVISKEKSLFTGYYAPFFEGSLTRTNIYKYPLRQKPDDLYTLNLVNFPSIKERGKFVFRLDSKTNKALPYFKRETINLSDSNPLVWLKSPIDAFFLHIQGSGFINLVNDEILHVSYHSSNGHKYRAIGRDLIEQGILEKEDVSMNTIRQFLEENPNKSQEIMNLNERYIFFKKGDGAVKGSLGVPLYKDKSLAIDPKYIPLGIPVFLDTKLTYNGKKFKSWMFTEDTGAAIKGGLRGDIYFGQGYDAGQFAGAQNEEGRLYVIVPN